MLLMQAYEICYPTIMLSPTYHRHPLLIRLMLMLACLSALSGGLYLSGRMSAALQASQQPAADELVNRQLAGLNLMEAMLALLFVLGCLMILREAYHLLVRRHDQVMTESLTHDDSASAVQAGAKNEIERLLRTLEYTSAQLASHRADEARLSRNAQEQERFATRSLEFIYYACAALAEQTPASETLSALLKDMVVCLDAECCALALLEPVASGLGLPLSISVPQQARILEQQSAQDLIKERGLRRLHRDSQGELLELAIPVRDAGETYGVLIVETRPDFLFESRHSRLIEAVAGLFALSLGNLLRNQRRRRLALLDERSAIAGELHDSLAQSLSFMKIQIARLHTEINRHCVNQCGPGTEAAEIAGELKLGVDSAYRQLRELLSAFRTNMPAGGLQQALRECVDELTARSGTEIMLDDQLGGIQLSTNEEFHVLQIVREALTNVIRHARAQHTLIRLLAQPNGEVYMVVEDDGRGLDDQAAPDGHYGLAIMQERTTQLGGSICFENLAEQGLQGTRITVRFLPVPTTH